MIIRKKPKPPVIKGPNLLFHFTEDEEKAMNRAVRKAEKFMETFGKGITPLTYQTK